MKVHEDFEILGGDMLDKLDTYIAACDAVVHLVGDMCGAPAREAQQRALLAKHSDLSGKLPRSGRRSLTASRVPTRIGRLGSPSIMASSFTSPRRTKTRDAGRATRRRMLQERLNRLTSRG